MVQPRKTRPCLTERLLMGRKESNQTKKNTKKQTNMWLRTLQRRSHLPAAYLDSSCIIQQYGHHCLATPQLVSTGIAGADSGFLERGINLQRGFDLLILPDFF